MAFRPMFRPVLILAALLLQAPSPALASAELARSKICLGCHAIDKQQIGPSFKAVAQRYAGQPDAAAKLAQKIMNGGKGVWGAVPMPANPKLTADEARRLAEWVLTVK